MLIVVEGHLLICLRVEQEAFDDIGLSLLDLGLYPLLLVQESRLNLVLIYHKITICDAFILHFCILIARVLVATWRPRIWVVYVVLIQAIIGLCPLGHLVESKFEVIQVVTTYLAANILSLL